VVWLVLRHALVLVGAARPARSCSLELAAVSLSAVSIRQHTSAYVSIRQQTSTLTYNTAWQNTSAYVRSCSLELAAVLLSSRLAEYVSIRQKLFYVSIRQKLEAVL
jgi:hypothetical protein